MKTRNIRSIEAIINARPTSDGAGVKLNRTFTPKTPNIDPFLMLDEISSDNSSDYMGGFPSHPHRGFETVTYMLQGKMRHSDHLGNEGLLSDGALQWMTAGRGVIHSEMPEKTDGGLHGFQLWVNLPGALKMQPAAYQEYSAESFPEVTLGESGNSVVKVIAGQFEALDANFNSLEHGVEGSNDGPVEGPVKNIATQASYFDVSLRSGDHLNISTEHQHTVLLYCFAGVLSIEGREVLKGQVAQMSKGDVMAVQAEESARFLLMSAMPIGEPVVNYGPFVMNTSEEIEQAMKDYQSGQLV